MDESWKKPNVHEYTYIKQMVTLYIIMLTCFAVPFPYIITDIALCARHIRWCLACKSTDATKQSMGTLLVGLGTICFRSAIKVGTFFCNSRLTVSQLKCFTASQVSLRIES